MRGARRTLAGLAVGALTAAGVLFTAPTAHAKPEHIPNGWADTWYTWTATTNSRDCWSEDFKDEAASSLCWRGLAHSYPQKLADVQPTTLEEFRDYVAEVQDSLKPGERVTLQFDRYVGPRGQVKKVVKDGLLYPGEDSEIAKEWHVVVLEGTTEQYVTWITATSTSDCSSTAFSDLAASDICGSGLAHVYPMQLDPNGPGSFDDLGVYLDQVKAGLAPGQKVTIQMDRYVGTQSAIDAVLEDRVLTVGEDSELAKDWRVVVLEG